MCAFRGHRVKSDAKVLKADAIIGYKVMEPPRRSLYGNSQWYRSYTKTCEWVNGRCNVSSRLLLGHTAKMRETPRGEGPGIYAWKTPADAFKRRSYGMVVVEVKLYGRVVEYSGRTTFDFQRGYHIQPGPGGFMAERAEIVRQVPLKLRKGIVASRTRR